MAVRHRLLGNEDVGLKIDGLHLMVEKSAIERVQQRFYNRWTHDHHIKNVFVFAPNGKVVIAGFNFHGKCHDSDVTDYCGIYDKFRELQARNGIKCTADLAFTGSEFPFLIKSGLSYTAPTIYRARIMDKDTSMRQSAEWGMRLYQVSYPRIRDKLKFSTHKKR